MKGLMQERPLDIPMIVRHAERLHPRKTVTSKTADGVRVATFAEVLNRARRLITALRRFGVGPDDRVATFCWNHQPHLEAYVGVPCMSAILTRSTFGSSPRTWRTSWTTRRTRSRSWTRACGRPGRRWRRR